MTVKQKRLQSAFIFSSRTSLCLVLCFSGIGAGRAQMPIPQASHDQSHLALIAGPGKQGTYVAGIAITMAPGSHTYWKMPGDAGVPPVFDFSGSQNVRFAHVRYPAPRRISEEGLEAFGYIGGVVFPVEVAAIDPAKPVVLTAEAAYAVCNMICIPAKGRASVTLEPDATGVDAARVEAALAAVPEPASPQQRAGLVLAREPGTAKPTWTLTWRGAAPVDDIFADAPNGAYFATRKTGPATWRLVAEQKPAAAEPVALTLARAAHPLVIEEKLDTVDATR